MLNRFARVAFAACTLVVGLAPAQAGDTLSNTDLAALFPGRFHGVVHGMVEVTIQASSNGGLLGEMRGETDSGRWRVSGGNLCIKWNEWTEGRYVCSKVTRNGQWFHANNGGPIRFRKY